MQGFDPTFSLMKFWQAPNASTMRTYGRGKICHFYLYVICMYFRGNEKKIFKVLKIFQALFRHFSCIHCVMSASNQATARWPIL